MFTVAIFYVSRIFLQDLPNKVLIRTGVVIVIHVVSVIPTCDIHVSS